MSFRTLLKFAAALGLGLCMIGCDTIVGDLIDLAIPYDLSITAPDTVFVPSLPCRPEFRVRLKRIGLPVSDTVIRVGDDYFLTDFDGEALCHQRFDSYGPNWIKVEALDSLEFVIADAERAIVIIEEK